MAPLMFGALCCTYTACDFDNFTCLCKEKSECLCLTGEQCLAVGEEPLGCGCVTNEENKECCKIGCFCCTYGCKSPETICARAEQCLCLKGAAACPFQEEYLNEFVCALYCLSCAPECGCCVEAPKCPALEKPLKEYAMERE